MSELVNQRWGVERGRDRTETEEDEERWKARPHRGPLPLPEQFSWRKVLPLPLEREKRHSLQAYSPLRELVNLRAKGLLSPALSFRGGEGDIPSPDISYLTCPGAWDLINTPL